VFVVPFHARNNLTALKVIQLMSRQIPQHKAAESNRIDSSIVVSNAQGPLGRYCPDIPLGRTGHDFLGVLAQHAPRKRGMESIERER
jgi:hypothetical protein